MGFVEETGAAQHYRDARIAPIYEGTNGIQAADLVTRKLGLEGGEALDALLANAQNGTTDSALAELAGECREIARWMRDEASVDDKLAGSVPFTTMCAVAVAGWQLARQAEAVAAGAAPSLAASKPVTARYFLEQVVPEALGLAAAARGGAEVLYALSTEALTA